WSDQYYADNEAFFRWTVPGDTGGGGNVEPVVGTPIADQTATVDEAFSFAVPTSTFSDPDGDALSFNATLSNGNALPSWLNFDTTSQTFTGTPEVSTDLSIVVTADDGNGGSVSDEFILSVEEDELTNGSLATVNVRADNAFTFYVNGTSIFSGSNWAQTFTFDADLAEGDLIAIEGIDTGGAGEIFVDIEMADGTRYDSGSDWLVETGLTGTAWTQSGFDDSGWDAASTYGTAATGRLAGTGGTGGALPSDTNGEWIWSDQYYADNEAFFRWTVPDSGAGALI
uniref:putative Ig domain-containing protein n=1 Tax=Amaricoccus macauensis TaxID=57001 RepID=UPI003C7D9A80